MKALPIALLALLTVGFSLQSAEPALGTYRGANATHGVDAFAQWLGRPTVWALDSIGSESWDNIGWPVWWMETWGRWVRAQPGRRLVFSVPMLPGPKDGTGPTQGQKGLRIPVSLEQGAAGAYNQHFTDLAQNLVKFDLTDTIPAPGWEFNGNWYAWQAQGHTKAFVEYWRQIVKTMHAVKGAEHLQFCWNPTLGEQNVPADQCWPGDDFADYVGLDVYDETWTPDTYPWPAGSTPAQILARQKKAWTDWIVSSPRGLTYWKTFAEQHHKPLAIPEWGLVWSNHQHGGLDDPYFIEQMTAFIKDPANHVAFHCYFDVNESDHGHQLSPGLPGSGRTEAPTSPFPPHAFARSSARISRDR